MKKIVGIIVLFFALILTNIGVAGIVFSESERNNEINKAANELVEEELIKNSFVRNYEQEIAIGIAFVIVGLLIFIFGIYLIASKTKKQREVEFELNYLKSQKANI